MTDYDQLSKIDFLPELATLDLHGKAKVIQSLLEESFFHPSGLFYSILLIDGPRHVRPMKRADMEGISDTVVEDCYSDGGASSEAAKKEGMTFENSIYSAGLYLQAQAARFAVTADSASYAESVRALNALRLIYDDGKRRNRAGWLGKPYGRVPKDHSTPDQYHAALLGLYRFREIAAATERQAIEAMLRDIADFLTTRNYQIWDIGKAADALEWNVPFAYCNTTYVLAQALAFNVTGDDTYRREALRLADLGRWRELSHLDEWRQEGHERFLEFERVCLGAFILQATDVLAELLPELFGDTPTAQRTTLRTLCERWWAYSQLGMDADGYQHYWIDIDVCNGTWRPTGICPNEKPPLPGCFFSYYSDVRWSDQLYRNVTGALAVVKHCPKLRDSTLAWIRDIMSKTDGRRLRWMIDLDGRQLKPDVKWMGCMLSSESPFHYLIAYWRGRKEG
jgi:hypothetical protein